MPWRIPLFSVDPITLGNNPYPLHLSRVARDPAADTNNQASADGSKHCSHCFSRDTIANAAAKDSMG